MLKSVQIKIILIFLLIGVIMISGMGYINYRSLKSEIEISHESVEEYNIAIKNHQEKQKIVTLCTVTYFICVSILVRYICNTKGN